jgi:hypothetical protein
MGAYCLKSRRAAWIQRAQVKTLNHEGTENTEKNNSFVWPLGFFVLSVSPWFIGLGVDSRFLAQVAAVYDNRV